MKRFKSELISGKKAPYSTWTFLVVPESIQKEWNKARFDVTGTINGSPFRGTAAKGEGVHRIPLKKKMLESLGLKMGDLVTVCIELAAGSRDIDIPEELMALLDDDPDLAGQYAALAPSMQRAWASYVDDAKRPETRLRRAAKAPDGIRARSFPNQ